MAVTTAASSCLVAVLLVVRSAPEPRLVFHYPPKPGEYNPRTYKVLNADADNTSASSTEDESETSVDDPIVEARTRSTSPKAASPPDMNEGGSASPEKRDDTAEQEGPKQEGEIFGLKPSVLAKLLCPNDVAHKTRFELGFAGKVFLGKPYFVNSDGTWKKAKKRRSSSKSTTGTSNLQSVIEESKAKSPDEELVEIKEDEPLDTDDLEDASGSDQAVQDDDGQTGQFGEASIHIPEKPKHPLNMFHVCLVLDPAPLEHHQRVQEMWKHIVKPISRSLRYEQAKSEYVSTEAAVISSTTKRFRKANANSADDNALYSDLALQSTLARSLMALFANLNGGRQQAISFSHFQSLSVQLPVPTAVESLASPFAPQQPGMWLSTAPSLTIEAHNQGPGSQLAAHFGLLLLKDTRSVLADIDTESPRAESMVRYLRASKSTKSFLQLSHAINMPLPEVLGHASSLIRTGRGRAIPPLKQRDIYIVSPNANMADLSRASTSFAKTFSTLPSLPKILSLLSGTPKPFFAIIPSRDHKDAYMNILVWLMQGGWVTQLRSFAWMRVPTPVLEKIHSLNATNGVNGADEHRHTPPSSSYDHEPEVASPNGTVTPHSTITAPKSPPSPPPSSPFIIHDPSHASPDHLSALSRHVRETCGMESCEAWEACAHYLDGEHALETVATIEGWKSKKTVEFFAEWERVGVLVRVRHW